MTDPQAKSPQPPSAKNLVDEEINLLDCLRVVWRYRWMIVALSVLAMTASVVTTRRAPRQYQSTVTIVPPLDILQKESGGGLGSLNSPLLRQVIDTAAGGIAKMYVEILESREVADSVVDRFRLMVAYQNTRYRSNARQRLKNNTKIVSTAGGL